MDRHARSRLNTQIYAEASEWFVESRDEDLDEAARREFDRWLRKSPEHVRAYLEIAAIWNEGASLDPAGKWDTDKLIAQAAEDLDNVIRLQGPAPQGPSVGPQPYSSVSEPTSGNSQAGAPRSAGRHSAQSHSPVSRSAAPRNDGPQSAASSEGLQSAAPQAVTSRSAGLQAGNARPKPQITRRRLTALAASVTVLGTMAGALIWAQLAAPNYTTAMGEQRSLEFPDGSTVELNSRSRIKVHYTEHERAVELISGQALFHVAKDHTRPFIVSAGNTRVRAVGTQFDVYKKQAGTVVTVVEGRVAVTTDAQAGGDGRNVPATTALSAGEQLTVTADALQKSKHPNIAGATSWTQRQLVFDSASLAEVAEEFNRYNKRQLILEGPAPFDFHISGVFASTDPDSLVRFLRARPGVHVTESGLEIRVTKIIPGSG